MIKIKNLTKLFGDKAALKDVSFNIEDGSVFGLIGSNGAGKSTLLRIMSGVFKADNGLVLLDGEEPYENIKIKSHIAFVSDYPYFLAGNTLKSNAAYFKNIYPHWSNEQYKELVQTFPIEENQKISAMSKGMQRQAAIILALSCCPKYILFDEIFDGLDPVIRELVKKILIDYVDKNKATVVIASHNLRELEGFCDHIGLLHLGGILLEKDIDGDAINLYKLQFVMDQDSFEEIKTELNIIKENRQGKLTEITVKGNIDEITQTINSKSPVFLEVLPLTLEELFISEMEAVGYDINFFSK